MNTEELLSIDKKTLGPNLVAVLNQPKIMNELDSIARKIVENEHISKDVYQERVLKYASNNAYNITKTHNLQSNVLKALSRGKLTYDAFRQLIVQILGYKLCRITMEFKRPDGSIFTEEVINEG